MIYEVNKPIGIKRYIVIFSRHPWLNVVSLFILFGLAFIESKGQTNANLFSTSNPSDKSIDKTLVPTFKGVKGFCVRIALDNRFSTTAIGLKEAHLKGIIKAKLRSSGIQTFSEEEIKKVPGEPTLVVTILGFRITERVYAYSVDLITTEDCHLVRDPSLKAYADTFKNTVKGVTLIDQVSGKITASMDRTVSRLINIVQTANPDIVKK